MRTSPNRLVGAILGITFAGLGVAGFFVTTGVGFVAAKGALLLGVFSVNPLQNVVHVLIGASLLITALMRTDASKTANSIVGAVCLALGLLGLFVAGNAFNVLAINGADNVLHFGTAALLLAVGLGADLRSPK